MGSAFQTNFLCLSAYYRKGGSASETGLVCTCLLACQAGGCQPGGNLSLSRGGGFMLPLHTFYLVVRKEELKETKWSYSMPYPCSKSWLIGN